MSWQDDATKSRGGPWIITFKSTDRRVVCNSADDEAAGMSKKQSGIAGLKSCCGTAEAIVVTLAAQCSHGKGAGASLGTFLLQHGCNATLVGAGFFGPHWQNSPAAIVKVKSRTKIFMTQLFIGSK